MNGFRSGEIRWGGYATRANGKAEWIVKLPDGMSTRHSQMLGTAGFTAMQSILRLEANGMTPHGGEVLVTGAGGGVGSEMCIRDRSRASILREPSFPAVPTGLLLATG